MRPCPPININSRVFLRLSLRRGVLPARVIFILQCNPRRRYRRNLNSSVTRLYQTTCIQDLRTVVLRPPQYLTIIFKYVYHSSRKASGPHGYRALRLIPQRCRYPRSQTSSVWKTQQDPRAPTRPSRFAACAADFGKTRGKSSCNRAARGKQLRCNERTPHRRWRNSAALRD